MVGTVKDYVFWQIAIVHGISCCLMSVILLLHIMMAYIDLTYSAMCACVVHTQCFNIHLCLELQMLCLKYSLVCLESYCKAQNSDS